MSSATAMEKYYGGVANYRAAEGKTVKVKYRGTLKDTVEDILGGVRSACTYIGAQRLKDVPKCTTFIRVSQQANEVFGRGNNNLITNSYYVATRDLVASFVYDLNYTHSSLCHMYWDSQY
jgi:hypothetical protein